MNGSHFRMAALRWLALPLLLALSTSVAAQGAPAPVDVGPYLADDLFEQITISPTGEYFAATVPVGDRTALVVMRRAGNVVTAQVAMGKDTHILDFWWVSDERLLMSMAETFGAEDQPSATGELFGMDADGGNRKLLVGYRAATQSPGTRLGRNNDQSVWASLVDDLPDVDSHVLISVSPFQDDPVSRVERMDVRSGQRVHVTRVPVRRASFVTDNTHHVRMAVGVDSSNASQLYHRANDDAEWTLINDENATRKVETPVGFSADDRIAYLRADLGSGPDALIAYDTVTGKRTPLLRDETNDPYRILYQLGLGSQPIGVHFDKGPVATAAYIDPDTPDARVYRMLEKAFPGQTSVITSTTRDGKLALVWVGSATNPGDFFLFDVDARRAEHLLSRSAWVDPAKMGTVRAVQVPARDGEVLHGVLTLPPGSDGKGLPMIVNPHGGPIGIRDDFAFNTETQMLAHAGYAVLQVNFRGSGGYGRRFTQLGAKQWGLKMQDDLTDATKWAIAQGIAAPDRICLYGASYGAYASLMGVAKEPSLYRCAVGYVGVYDLDKVVREDSSDSNFSKQFASQWIGARGQMAATSPNRFADRIKVPVFLAAGGEDRIAPVEHTELMEAALRKAGVPVESLYFKNEAHGFYALDHRREYSTRLLDFLARHLGGARATATATAKAKD